MSNDQFDLFEHNSDGPPSPAAAEVIPFPCSKRLGKARKAATIIFNKKTDKMAQAYWKDLISKMAARMRRDGIDENRIEREIASFGTLVRSVLDRHVAQSQA